jgi:hypothetical protein
MKCVECRAQVEAYFDDELDEQTTLLMAQHLKVCPSCASLLAVLEGEQELFLRYECDTLPAPDFWDSVMARAAAQAPAVQSSRPLTLFRDWLGSALGNFNARRFSPSLTALLVVAAIGLTIGVMRFTSPREKGSAPENISQNTGAIELKPAPVQEKIVTSGITSGNETESGKGSPPGANEQPSQISRPGRKSRSAFVASNETSRRNGLKSVATGRTAQTPDELVREAEQKYVAAIAMLSRDVNRRRSRLDAETITRFERTLAAVDRTIADTRQAARKHPGDPVAAQYMLTAYAKKVDVLREMVGY